MMRDPRNTFSPLDPALRLALPLVLGTLALSGCASFPAGSSPSLRDEIEEVLSTPPLDQVHWGIRVVDPERGQVLYSRNGHRKFIPASNMKILGTSAALTLLGPEWRYRNEIWGVGVLDSAGGTLEGDLVFRASGDPTFSERYYPSAEAPLDSLAQHLWDAGVRSVSGSLVVDVSGWDSTAVPGSWMVGDLPTTSGASGGAFALGEGLLTVEVTAGETEGAPARARWWPNADPEFITVSYLTVHADSGTRGRRIDYLPESRRLKLEGLIRMGEVDTLRTAQRDPVRLASAALLRAVERRGIQVQGGLRIAWERGEPLGPGVCVSGPELRRTVGDEEAPDTGVRRPTPGEELETLGVCAGARTLATLSSPTMAEIVQGILEPSQNWMTEQLVRTLGMELGSEGSWREAFRVEREFFEHEVGVDSLDIQYRDGSGMSAQNLVTPRGVVRILEFMRASSNAGIYRNALAGPGEDGTLRSRLEGLEGRVFAKTGTLTNVASLSGYLFTDSGRELIFSILTNGSGLPSSDVRRGIDAIVEVLARY